MASLAELKDLIKLALGTPETVNFKALNRLLVSIIQRLGVLYRKTDRVDSNESVEGGKKIVTQPATRKKTRHEERDKLRIEEKNRRASKGKDAEKKDLNEKRPEEKTGSQKSSTEAIPGTDKEEAGVEEDTKEAGVEEDTKEAGLEEDTKGDDQVSSELKTGPSGEAISNGENKDKERKGSKTSSEENSEEAEDQDGKRRRASKQSKKTEDCDYNGKGGTKKRTKKKSEDNVTQQEDFVFVEDYGSDYGDDFDDKNSSSGSDARPSEFVPKQDFDDIVKRLQIMEKEMGELQLSKGKAPLRQMGRGTPDTNRAQVSDRRAQVSEPAAQVSVLPQVSTEALEKMEAIMRKRIELAMQLNTPVLARVIEGNHAVIQDGQNGLLFSKPEEFHEKALRLLYCNDCRNRLVVHAAQDVETEKKERITSRTDFNLLQRLEDRRIFLLVGAVRPVKDPIYLMETFSQLKKKDPKILFVIIGPVSDEKYNNDEFQPALQRYPGVVVHIPGLPSEDTHAAIQQSFALVNSSKSEGMSLAILEAMHLNTPVLARNIEGNSAVIQDGQNGLLFSEPEEFHEKALRLLYCNDCRNRLVVKAAQDVAKHYNLETEKKAYLEIVQQNSTDTGPSTDNRSCRGFNLCVGFGLLLFVSISFVIATKNSK